MLLIFIIGLLLAAIACAGAVRLLRASGAAVLGGIVAGILLGPTLLGRVAPGWYEQHIVGAREERIARDRLAADIEREGYVRERIGLGNDERAESLLRQDLQARQAWRDAKREHQAPVRWTSVGLATAYLLLAAACWTRPEGRDRADWYPPLSIGLWLAAAPAGATMVLLRWLDEPLVASIAAGAAVAIGPAVLALVDRDAAADAEPGGERIMRSAARIATIVSFALFAWAMIVSDGSAGIWSLAPVLAVAAGWLLSNIIGGLAPLLRGLIEWIVKPAVAAIVAVRLELYEHVAFWPLLIILILCGDGRWFGAYVGAMLATARRSLPTMRLALAAMSAGPAQIALTAIALDATLISEHLALALLFGALVMEMTTGARERLNRRIRETEEELE